MLCKRPFVRGAQAYGCGQCLPCRINRRRLWVHRMLLEACTHREACFVTLTYDQAHHPADGNLSRRDLVLFFKRLRRAIAPLKFRYFGVGEYGETTWRPHYHAAIFGIGPSASTTINEAWGLGYTMTGTLSRQSCSYVAGYVTKKLTRKGDGRLGGRTPEFACMSLRPGIGAHSMATVAAALNDSTGAQLVARLAGVPMTLMCGTSPMPLGRYLRQRLRSELGVEIPPDEHIEVKASMEEMRRLRAQVGRLAFEVSKPFIDWQRIAQVEARHRIWKKHETL